jgi:hypothetical protein
MKCFADMCKNGRPDNLRRLAVGKSAPLFSKEQDYRTQKQHAGWHQRDQCLKQWGIHSLGSGSHGFRL